MKSIVRNTALNGLALFFVTLLVSGVVIEGGFMTYVVSGLALTLLGMLVRPILTLITLPLNMVTFGAFSVVISTIILYLLTVFVPQVTIADFVYEGVKFAGFTIPRIEFNTFFTFVLAALLISGITSLIKWLIK